MRVQRTNASRPAAITCSGEGIVNHVGARALVELADRSGLTAALDVRPASRRQRRSQHAPGAVLRDVAVMLADGGSCLSDLEVLAGQAELFDETASVATAWRTLEAVAADELGGVEGLRTAGQVRRPPWRRVRGPRLPQRLR